MRSSPRAFAEKLLEKVQLYGLIDGPQQSVLLDVAEEVIREAVAFELKWLAEFLAERAKREGPQEDEPPMKAVQQPPPSSPRGW